MYGSPTRWRDPVAGGRGGLAAALRRLDAFPKEREDAAEYFHSTMAGGIITVVAAIAMTLLFLSELGA